MFGHRQKPRPAGGECRRLVDPRPISYLPSAVAMAALVKTDVHQSLSASLRPSKGQTPIASATSASSILLAFKPAQ